MLDIIKQTLLGAYVLFTVASIIALVLFMCNIFVVLLFNSPYLPVFVNDNQVNWLSMLVVFHGFVVSSYMIGKE